MITAVDTNVLVDIIISDDLYRDQSLSWIEKALSQGIVLVCDVVYAELVSNFGENRASLDQSLRELNVSISPLDTNIAYIAGLRWAEYRKVGGPRTRILPDFLIGAHALLSADSFLTRDEGFYRTYFPELLRH